MLSSLSIEHDALGDGLCESNTPRSNDIVVGSEKGEAAEMVSGAGGVISTGEALKTVDEHRVRGQLLLAERLIGTKPLIRSGISIKRGLFPGEEPLLGDACLSCRAQLNLSLLLSRW